jgi:acylphosphatase
MVDVITTARCAVFTARSLGVDGVDPDGDVEVVVFASSEDDLRTLLGEPLP